MTNEEEEKMDKEIEEMTQKYLEKQEAKKKEEEVSTSSLLTETIKKMGEYKSTLGGKNI